MSWEKYSILELRSFAKKHNDMVKIEHPSKLKKDDLIKELDKHFEWKGEKVHHKLTGKMLRIERKGEEKKEEDKKEEKKEKEAPKKEKEEKKEMKKEEKKEMKGEEKKEMKKGEKKEMKGAEKKEMKSEEKKEKKPKKMKEKIIALKGQGGSI